MASLDSFLAGFAYGTTTVVVGQPLDTIKTRMQAMSSSSMLSVTKDIVKREGIRGLYRGGVPLLVGGSLFRSAQFGVYDNALRFIRDMSGGPLAPSQRIWGCDPQIMLAGLCGGIGRGLVEGPFEYVKVRRQVEQPWKITELYSGASATIFRNSFLFCLFVTYMDLSKQMIEGGLSPFWTGAICSNLAWLSVWPLDVAKSQLQSGNYVGKSFRYLVVDTIRSGKLFRGIVPGLTRSTIANGLSMVVYRKVEAWLARNDAENSS